MRTHRLLGTLVATLMVAAGVPLLTALPADASAYRYWSYWHGDSGSWQFSGVGPATWRVHDGSVEGWRFAVSPNTRTAPPPQTDAPSAFDTVCRGTKASTGTARVALIVDFGTAADAPPGSTLPADALGGDCVQVPTGASGIDVLNQGKVAVRTAESGLVCGLAGYPSTGCGEVVGDGAPSPTPTRPSPGPTHVPRVHPSKQPSAATSTGAVTPPGQSTGDSAASARAPDATTRTATRSPTPGATSTQPTPSGSGADVGRFSPGPTATPSLTVGLVAVSGGSASSGGTPWPALLVLVLVVALGGATMWRSRHTNGSR